jgi:hypothetical protein
MHSVDSDFYFLFQSGPLFQHKKILYEANITLDLKITSGY